MFVFENFILLAAGTLLGAVSSFFASASYMMKHGGFYYFKSLSFLGLAVFFGLVYCIITALIVLRKEIITSLRRE
jgi:ABC-type antimicrobial peptide transport system permease subunit